MEFDDAGMALNKPLPASAWTDVCPNSPPGLFISRDEIPPGMIVYENYLPPLLCERLRAECDKLSGAPVGVHSHDASDHKFVEARTSESIDIDGLALDVRKIVRDLLQKFIGPHFHREMESFERPEVLRYQAGGEYRVHSDRENWSAEERRWKRVVDRDISLLLYFNDDFAGGELVFPNFGLRLRPKAGRVVVFPSDYRFVHGALPVTSGTRYVIVSWALFKGSERVESSPRGFHIRI